MNDIKELATAFAKAQQEIEGAIADKTNPAFRSKYADLGNVIDAIKPALRDHGLSFTQICHDADNAAKVETLILHASGQSLSCGVVSVPVSKHDAQGYGSALTYARRYSLAAAFGVAPEDDDGNAAAKAAPKKQEKSPSKPVPTLPEPAKGEKTTAEKLMDELADWCKGDEEAMEAALAQYSEYSGKHLTLQRLRSPDADPERRVKVMKWAGSTLGKIREKREVKELCNECRQPMTGGKCVNQSCPNCEPF